MKLPPVHDCRASAAEHAIQSNGPKGKGADGFVCAAPGRPCPLGRRQFTSTCAPAYLSVGEWKSARTSAAWETGTQGGRAVSFAEAVIAGGAGGLTVVAMVAGWAMVSVPLRVARQRGRGETPSALGAGLRQRARQLWALAPYSPAVFVFSLCVALIAEYDGRGIIPYVLAVVCIFGTVGMVFAGLHWSTRLEGARREESGSPPPPDA